MAASPSAATDLSGVLAANLRAVGSFPLEPLIKACDCGPLISFSAAWKSVCALIIEPSLFGPLESVPKVYQGLQSFRNISRMEASRRKASALRLRFSKSLPRRRQRLVGSETGAPV